MMKHEDPKRLVDAGPISDPDESARSSKPAHSPNAKSRQFLAVAQILYELSDQSDLGVLELSRRARVSVGTAQRITAALVESELLSWSAHTRRYSLGIGILRLKDALVDNALHDMQRCISELEGLSRKTGETAALNRRVGSFRAVIAQVVGNHDLTWRSDVGRLYPLHAGAASMALLAFLPGAELDALLDGYAYTLYQPATPGSRAELDCRLAEVRRSGVASSFGERERGAGGIAVPIYNSAGTVEYSLSLYGPEQRIRASMEQLTATVRDTVARISGREHRSQEKWHQ